MLKQLSLSDKPLNEQQHANISEWKIKGCCKRCWYAKRKQCRCRCQGQQHGKGTAGRTKRESYDEIINKLIEKQKGM